MIENAADAIVYIVDDDAAVRDSLKILLETNGLRVEDFGSPEEFTVHYRPSPHACLVLDQHLAATNGVEFLVTLRDLAPGLPVILVTGRGDSTIETRARDAGAVAYFEKPVAEVQLVSTIRGALRVG